MEQPTFEVVPGSRDDIRIFRVIGPMTLACVFEFQNAAREVTQPNFILDLSQVPYMDSAALGAVINLHVSSNRHNRKFAVAGASPRLMTMFQVAGVHNFLSCFASVEDAEKS